MTLVVGHAPHKPDRAPLHLAAMLARSAGEDLDIVVVVPAPWPTPVAGGTDREFEEWSLEQGDRGVADATEAIAELCPDLHAVTEVYPGKSAAATLIERAEEVDARMIVVGSGTDGSWGKVVMSSTSERLLHSSPLPVAVATRGFRSAPGSRVVRATCAFRGDENSRAVLAATASLCKSAGAALRVVTFGVRGRTMYPPEVIGEDDVLAAYVEQAVEAQRAAIDALGPDRPAEVETVVGAGRSWAEALDDVHWDTGDVLVLGSSSASWMQRLFLGSNASKIVRHSPVPVIVVP